MPTSSLFGIVVGLSIIAIIVALSYYATRPIKKTYAGRSTPDDWRDQQLTAGRSIPKRPIVVGGTEAKPRSMHRDNDIYITPYMGSPVNYDPGPASSHPVSHARDIDFGGSSSYDSGSDHSSSGFSSDSGSSGGGDGGGGGGGD